MPPLPGEEFEPEAEKERIELEYVPEKFPKFLKIEPIKEHIPIKPIPTLPSKEAEEGVKRPKVVVKEQKFPGMGRDMFVKADKYKEILEGVDTIKRKVKESEDILESLNEIKNIKDEEFEKWRTLLEDVERKSVYIDKTLFER